MSESKEHFYRDFSKFDEMSTEELNEILRQDSQLPDGEDSDTDAILYMTVYSHLLPNLLTNYFHSRLECSIFLSRSISSETASFAGLSSKSTLFTSSIIGILTSYFSARASAAFAE